MPRMLVLGNGNVLVNFDGKWKMRDFFYPIVGMDNQIGGRCCSIGLWERGHFSWLEGESWQRRLSYHQESLVALVQAVSNSLGLEVVSSETVHPHYNLFVRQMEIKNLQDRQRQLRVFFTHDFSLGGNEIGDTALFDPVAEGVCHYKRDIYLLASGMAQGKGIFQFATGKRFGSAEGTWRDAEDGWLEGNPIDHGAVDSVISLELNLDAGASDFLWYWIAMGEGIKEVRELNQLVLEQGPASLLQESWVYWQNWVNRHNWDFGDLPEKVGALFKQSLLLVRTQCDNRGAILAANDTDIMATARDHYSYMWPRDAALVAIALDRAGFPEVPERLFPLCARILSEDGYYLQKYNADGTPGSSWHPWLQEDGWLPIQLDETALVSCAIWHHYTTWRNLEALEPLYRPLIKRIGDFLFHYRHSSTGLPLPSYDLWEERRGIFSFTTAAVYAGLSAAAAFAELFGDRGSADLYRQGALEVQEGMERCLYDSKLGRFLRGIYPKDGTEMEFTADYTLDSSLYGLFALGAFAADDPRVVRTMTAVQDALWVKTEVGGLARYTGDWYFRRSEDFENVPGSPWFITTLWLAEWYIAKARTKKELEFARRLLEWTADHALPSGVLSEQLHPYTGEPQSVAPLTWSHSTFILAVVNYLDRWHQL
jgi:GH15 family glucan-1,4-alpha-glucosidase